MHFNNIDRVNFRDFQRIYLEGISTGNATFETEAPDYEKWDSSRLKFGRIALYDDSDMLGWASLARVSDRCVYQGVTEVSVYVAEAARGKGCGKLLLKELIRISEENGIWTLQAGMMRENTPTIRLHEKCGFRQIGYREKVGKLHGVWRDNIIMERRSKVVGIN